MSDLLNAELVQARNQYINHLLPNVVDMLSKRAGVGHCGELLTKLIDKGLAYVEERARIYCSRLLSVEGNDESCVQTLVNDFIYLEEYLMQTYRNRIRDGTSDLGQSVPDPSLEWTHKYIHQEVLTKVHPDFLEGVNLDSTNIMDRMIEESLMTEDERESIVQEKTSKRRKEEFLLLMRGRLSYRTLVDNFIPAVGEDHPDVAGKIKTLIAQFQSVPPRLSVCAVCNMKDTIQVKHLAEHLHTNGLISPNMHQDLRSSRMTNESKWSVLLSNVSNWNLIAEAVNLSFPKVYEALKKDKAINLECRCQDVNEADLSLKDYSVTTDQTLVPDVANLDDLESLLDASETASAISTVESLAEPSDMTGEEVKYQHSEVRQDKKEIGQCGGVIVSTLMRHVQVEFPQGALANSVVIGLNTHLISPELVAKHFNNTDAISPVITVEPRCRRARKPITLTIPVPKMTRMKSDLRLLYNISDGKSQDVWVDITNTKPMRHHTDCISFETIVTARYWLICSPRRNNIEQLATLLYMESVGDVHKPEFEDLKEDVTECFKQQHRQQFSPLWPRNADRNDVELDDSKKDGRNPTGKFKSFTQLSKNTENLW